MAEPFIDGSSIYLRPVRRDDYSGPYLGWINDRIVTRYLSRGTTPVTVEDQIEDYEALRKSADDIEFCIVERAKDQPIGLAGLHSFQWIYRSAEFRILIGARRFWGKGIGTEVAQLLAAYGFEILNLNKVWLGASSGNKGAVRSYQKAGFANEGTLRQEIFRNGRYYDVTRMSLLRAEYDKVFPTWPIHDLIDRQYRDSD